MKKLLSIFGIVFLMAFSGLILAHAVYQMDFDIATDSTDVIISDQTQQTPQDPDSNNDKEEEIVNKPVDKGQNDPNEIVEAKPVEEEEETETTPPPPAIEYFIRVNRQANCITIYTKDDAGNFTIPVKAMVCSVGLDDGTPLGTYRTTNKYVWRQLFHDVFGQYATRITGHILFHSVPYYEAEKDTLLSEEYNNLGQAASAGCVRLSVEDAKWIYDNCESGTTVEIYDAEDPGPLGKPESIPLDLESEYADWDPTDPDENNPWLTALPSLDGVADLTVERGEDNDLKGSVVATDYDGKEIPFEIEGTYDLNQCGTYEITYVVINAVRHKVTATATITVTDTKGPTIVQEKIPSVFDSTEDILEVVLQSLTIKDAQDNVDKKNITIDLSALEAAMNTKSYGTYSCSVTATDAYGNTGNATISVYYEPEDATAPTITITQPSITTTVDLTDVSEDNERTDAVELAAMAALILGENFTITDDFCALEDIEITKNCEYSGSTTAGTYTVTVTLTATDESGKTTTIQVDVLVTIVDNTTVNDDNNN